MATRLKLESPLGKIDLEGEDNFVREVYGDFKIQLATKDREQIAAKEEIRELIADARISGTWNEYQRAFTLYQRALEKCSEGTDSTVLADIFEGMDEMERAIEQIGLELPAIEAAVQADPEDAEKRFRLAIALSRMGQANRAFVEYERAMKNPENLCKDCFRDLWNNIGWYYYRRGLYQEALRWFDQACQVANIDEDLGHGLAKLGMENTILTYCALKLITEAEASAKEYVSRFGRLQYPERRALARLNIDADAIYVERCRSN